jgi:hypothetical protein
MAGSSIDEMRSRIIAKFRQSLNDCVRGPSNKMKPTCLPAKRGVCVAALLARENKPWVVARLVASSC